MMVWFTYLRELWAVTKESQICPMYIAHHLGFNPGFAPVPYILPLKCRFIICEVEMKLDIY